MIHAGVMRIGSRRTCGVLGAYWMSSINLLRKMTSPLVRAIVSPTLKLSMPFSFSPLARRPMSSASKAAPAAKFAPPVARAASTTSGFVPAKLTGARAFRPKRPRNSTRLT